jgi:8-oxo-dGTP pyrophosphatase MutT (NUDIX family)
MKQKPNSTLLQMPLGQPLFRDIQSNLGGFDSQRHNVQGTRQAAVAVTLVEVAYGSGIKGMSAHANWNRAAALILTRRKVGLKDHSGQWALPGGRREPSETLEQTALRELSEEVGLVLDGSHIMGRLDDFTTRSGFTITPIVVWGGADVELKPNPDEVASIHRIPLTEFMRSDAPVLHAIAESDDPVLFMPVGDTWIAAPTAAIIYQFREVALLGNHTRVAHYEQPYFAWN